MEAKIKKNGCLYIKAETKKESVEFEKWIKKNVSEEYSINGETRNINGENVIFNWYNRSVWIAKFDKKKHLKQ